MKRLDCFASIYILSNYTLPELFVSIHCLAFATGVHGENLCFVLVPKNSAFEALMADVKITYVLYVLNAERLRVSTGLCSFGSHKRTPVCKIGSDTGGLSTIYEIHACLDVG